MALPTLIALGASAASLTAISPALPAGMANGNPMVLIVESYSGDAVTAPTGWVATPDSPQDSNAVPGSNDTRLSVFWRRFVTGDGAPTVADTGDHQFAFIAGFDDGATSGDPWDVSAGAIVGTAATAISWPGDTTTAADSLILLIASTGHDAAGAQASTYANANLANITERFDNQDGTGNGGGLLLVTGELATAGAIGTTTGVFAANRKQALITLAMKDGSGGGDTNPPTVTLSAQNKANIFSNGVNPDDRFTVAVKADETWDAYRMEIVANAASVRGSGTVIYSGDPVGPFGPDPAGATLTVVWADLNSAGFGADGAYVYKVWVQDAANNWSDDATSASGAFRINTLVPATESDTAVSQAATKNVVSDVAAETDAGVAQAVTKTAAPVAALEADSAVAQLAQKSVASGFASETETAVSQQITRIVFASSAVETDSAHAQATSKSATPVPALEVDSAVSQAVSGPVGAPSAFAQRVRRWAGVRQQGT